MILMCHGFIVLEMQTMKIASLRVCLRRRDGFLNNYRINRLGE